MKEAQAQVGGQAVIEGVMMRAPKSVAVAVRRVDTDEIVVRDETWRPAWGVGGLERIPILRGVLVLLDSVLGGYRALAFAADEADRGLHRSAGISVLTRLGTDAARALTLPALALGGAPSEPRPRGASHAGPLALSLLVAMLLFVGLPHLLAWLVIWLGGGLWHERSLAFHLLDGSFKLSIFVGYLALIGKVPEIARVFAYHGAEHKVVNAFERGRPLDLDEARLQGTFHARCGTSFLIVVLLLSVATFAVLLPALPPLSGLPLLDHAALVVLKVVLTLPLAGVAYELNRWSARHPGAPGVAMLVAPGRWLQRLTTREPSDDQLEVALAAMWVALDRERSGIGVERTRVFADLAAVRAATHTPRP